MKTKYYILGAALCSTMGLGLTSCNNDEFLNVTHYSLLEGDAMFENDENAIKGMTGCYDQLLPRTNDDPYKYWIFNGCHPTMDSQASGWDKDFMVQKWTASQAQLKTFWTQSYTCASRCNDFLAGLEASENVSDDVKRHLEGEAKALRGFQFFGLANTFGRVPLLITGENYINTPTKPKAESFTEMWDFVIKDFKEAAELLDWKPFQGQYGRCTKGMALAFLGDAYMWKAYTVPETAQECYQMAYDAFQQIIKSGEYELNPSFTTLYDADEAWPKECIWQILLNCGDEYGSWDNSKHAGAHGWTGFYFGPTSNGAWGTYQMSWELYDSFENYIDDPVYGNAYDKRRDGSMVTATVPFEMRKDHPTWEQRVKPTQKWLDSNIKYIRGYSNIYYDEKGDTIKWTDPDDLDEKGQPKVKPYTLFKQKNGEIVGKKKAEDGDVAYYVYSDNAYEKYYNNYKADKEAGCGIYDPTHPIGFNPFNQEFVGWCGFHWTPTDPAPTVWSTKHWRNGRGCDWSTGMLWLPDHIYFKRYANVLLDQAECCFRLGKEAEGWALVKQIRERAFGNTEVGKDLSKYIAYHQKIANFYGDQGHGDAVDLAGYPFPFNTETVNVPDAKEYYTKIKNEYGYSSEVWKVAVNIERRKEFSAEPYLRSDMHKSGFLEDHVNTVYPKNNLPESGNSVIQEWRTARNFDFDMNKMFMPIPENEILMNPDCVQNEGYTGTNE
ncbi:RagB/SusD family nutrient uptake outer membrane protein [Prevotella sp. P6B1]|uniref:RagB/SusD family nutrient uptake outer membrane protein n=1 Tax=Prevotella sp. P6B1 TaxID=1410613 RepID=UPI00051AE5A7|nr:RagB/SusD family nutrient uptake outer membrane protein [Prevotella sp. P6B1]